MKTIKIKYFDDAEPIKQIDKGNWIDLKANETIKYNANEFHMLKLGVAMQLPEGYEANVVPRSSTYKHYGIVQTNSYGVIDESYCGDNDQWRFPFYSLREGVINKGDRVCQFRINEVMGKIEFQVVDHLGNEDRNGFGSTGK